MTKRGRNSRRKGRDSVRARVLREWRGADNALDPNRNVAKAGDLLGEILGSLRLREGIQESRLRAGWRKAAGDFVARHTEPVSLQDGILVLRVLQPAMRFHLEQSRSQIVARVGRQFGTSTVREVRFTIG